MWTPLERELAIRAADPLRAALAGLTPTQRGFLNCDAREAVAEGGNQSGKTWSACLSFLAQALGIHPAIRQTTLAHGERWKGWYATCTYELFAQQAWPHWRRLLFFPGEELRDIPTRRVLGIGWESRIPEKIKYLLLRRADGREAEVWIKSFDQGRGEFQAAEVDALVIDEECPEEIYQEAQPRVVKRSGRIIVTATPVLGVRWLEDLRRNAEIGDPDVKHFRFRTLDNPALAAGAAASLVKKYDGRPELLRLRLEGIPLLAEGRVYPDTLFTPAHVCPPRELRNVCRYRCIDHGWRACACLWLAVDSSERVWCYREYLGQEMRLGENAARIKALSGGESYEATWIDPATLGRDAETGQRLIDLWLRHLDDVRPAPDNRVMPGIELVSQLLADRVDTPAGRRPRFQVFQSCQQFLAERRGYLWSEAREKGDEGPEKPIKREDHLMDCWRYLIAAGLRYTTPRRPLPPANTLGRRLYDRRHSL